MNSCSLTWGMVCAGKTNVPYPMPIFIAGGIQSLPELPSQEIVDI
ncbi:hypothetical protein [Nostoc sp. 106C]|nr:hypothetical protein [Nostoc sp. 106C]